MNSRFKEFQKLHLKYLLVIGNISNISILLFQITQKIIFQLKQLREKLTTHKKDTNNTRIVHLWGNLKFSLLS